MNADNGFVFNRRFIGVHRRLIPFRDFFIMLLDLLAEVAGIGSYEEVRKESVPVDAFGRKFATLNVRALIRAKRAAAAQRSFSTSRT